MKLLTLELFHLVLTLNNANNKFVGNNKNWDEVNKQLYKDELKSSQSVFPTDNIYLTCVIVIQNINPRLQKSGPILLTLHLT